MELELLRTGYPHGTNGMLYCNGNFQCYTIELPWLNNQHSISCIPTGRYRLKQRYSPKHKTHVILEGVKDRALILIHPANNALKELKGCIAPVSILTGEGTGNLSRKATESLMQLVLPAIKTGSVFITIKNKTT